MTNKRYWIFLEIATIHIQTMMTMVMIKIMMTMTMIKIMMTMMMIKIMMTMTMIKIMMMMTMTSRLVKIYRHFGSLSGHGPCRAKYFDDIL